jgi:hypothetical protein
MYSLEPWRSRQAAIPLPPASYVIDLRVDEDDMIERLRIEVGDLTNEMKTQETHHWRFLADFLAFSRIPPMSTEEINLVRPARERSMEGSANRHANSVASSNGISTAHPAQPVDQFQQSLTGSIPSFVAQANNSAILVLSRTELINERGQPGKYHERLGKLDGHFRALQKVATERQAMVRRRLGLSFSETQPGTRSKPDEPWLNLRIRDERLDVETLADGYSRLNERLGQEIEEIRDLAEQLIRSLGPEQPASLEKEFRERSQAQYSIRRNPQVLMTTLVATAQRISIQGDSLTSIQPLIGRYKDLESGFANELYLMKALIDTISYRLSRMMLQPLLEEQVVPSRQDIYNLSISAFETWSQMLWEDQDPDLDQALAGTGVMPKLLDSQDSATFVKRLLALRTSLFGQSVQPGQIGDLYVLIPPSAQSHNFRQSLNLPRRSLVEFPDVERLILLYIQRYSAPPMQIALPPAPASNEEEVEVEEVEVQEES